MNPESIYPKYTNHHHHTLPLVAEPRIIHILHSHIFRLAFYKGGIVNKAGTRRALTWSQEQRSYLSPDIFAHHHKMTSNRLAHACGIYYILPPHSPKHSNMTCILY